MLKFKKIGSADLKIINKYINNRLSYASDISIGFLEMWKDVINAQYSLCDDTIIIKVIKGEGEIFSFPFGNNIDNMLNELLIYTNTYNIPIRFYALNLENIEYLKNINIFNNLKYDYEDRFSDYIYSYNDILDFSGKKFKGQRNHINKYIKLYGNPNTKILTKDDIDDVYKMLSKYELEHDYYNNLMEKYELDGTKKLLNSFIDLNLIGLCIKLNDEIIAFDIGEVINDTLIIHIEKALKKYEGIYPTMFNCFIKYVNENYKDIKYINREDDSGDIGIRTSKMQYHPIKKENKYQLHADSINIDIDYLNIDDLYLTYIKESDKLDYYNLNIDEDINKYYGYNYKEDLYLAFPINEDAFYNSLIFDTKIGDSINFMIRNNIDSNLIGECILWHITNKNVEIGIRLFGNYHKNGIGVKIFNFISNYVKNNLKIEPIARCYKENIKSYKMIINSGYIKNNEDNNYYYFKFNK